MHPVLLAIALTSVLSLPCAALAQDVAAAEEIVITGKVSGPPLWQVRNGDKVLWIFGLLSPLPPQLELDTTRIDALARARGLRIAYPRIVDGERMLAFHEVAIAELVPAKFGLREPTPQAPLVELAELTALVASGPLAGKQQTYALLDERAPFRKVPPRDEMLGMLARRFFASHGPATVRHFAWWSGLSLRDSRAGLAGDAAEFEHERIEGKDWHGFTGREPRAGALEGAFLIPEYDEVLTGWRDLGVADHARTKRGWKDFFLRPIVLDGARAGTWRRSIVKDRVLVEANLFTRLGRDAERKVGRAATRLGEFLRVPAKLARWDGRKD